ncbi:MAG: transposase [Verrucomicrobiales bacterium]|nr:transposase [Verrucomicrobiaceae bacterium]
MGRKRFSEEQIIGILRESGTEMTTKELCAKHNISLATLYAWKRKYGEMDVAEARRLKALETDSSTA